MKKLIFISMIFIASGLFAAPLTGNYPSAPRATPAEARQRVINAGRKYLGTPYLYAGMSSRGIDCSGFVCLSFSDALGETLPRSAAGLHTWAEKIALNRAQPGDLLFFKTGSTSAITHVAIYLGDNNFIHAASDGPKTGVIYSSLDETYWKNAFVTAGRALPVAPSNFRVDSGTGSGGRTTSSSRSPSTPSAPSGKASFFAGAALAPTWDFHMLDGDVIRGVSSQIFAGVDFSTWLSFGFEIRPEYDGALGVYRIPFTLSWGHKDMLRIFLGPVVNIGDAVISIGKDDWAYSGGTSWLGTVGVTFAPYTFKIKKHDIAPYLEAAWQSYFSDNEKAPLAADFIAGFRFSTGLRWRIHF